MRDLTSTTTAVDDTSWELRDTDARQRRVGTSCDNVSHHEREPCPRCGIVHARSQTCDGYRRCCLPSYREQQLQQHQQHVLRPSGVLCVVRSEELTEGYGIVTEVFVTWHITRVLYLTYFWKKRRF